MHPFIQPIAAEFAEVADPEKALAMKAYMKNRFDFFGIPTPARREICKAYMKKFELKSQPELEAVVKELWLLPQREFQYFAIDLLNFSKKLWQTSIIDLFEFCLTHKSWWDTVDAIASDVAGFYFKKFPGLIIAITGKWNKSKDIWLQRTSLLFQKSYKKDTNTHLISAYIINLSTSKEFFVQKAIGWILREYAKTNADWVKTFVNEHALAPLSKREAMRHF